MRKTKKKTKTEKELEEMRKRDIAKIKREFSGVEQIMALEWAGYL